MACRFHHLLLLTSALLPLAAAPALAGPDGANVVGGAATIQGQGTANVTINQISDRAVINWNQFNIGAGERTQFVQPGSSSVALNRVTGGLGPTEILGTLSANGRVFVINRDGILFGPNAKVDTAGFLATTSDISNSDFMAGRYNFNIPGRPDASIINQGTITAHNAGFAALVAPGVRNSGTITATLGTVGLAAGNSFTLDFYGDKLISLAVGDSDRRHGARRADRPPAHFAGREYRPDQRQRRPRRAHRGGRPPRGQLGHQQSRRHRGEYDRPPQRHDRARRRHRRLAAGRRAASDRAGLGHALCLRHRGPATRQRCAGPAARRTRRHHRREHRGQRRAHRRVGRRRAAAPC